MLRKIERTRKEADVIEKVKLNNIERFAKRKESKIRKQEELAYNWHIAQERKQVQLLNNSNQRKVAEANKLDQAEQAKKIASEGKLRMWEERAKVDEVAALKVAVIKEMEGNGKASTDIGRYQRYN